MPPAGFEPAILPGDRLQTHALDRSATGIGSLNMSRHEMLDKLQNEKVHISLHASLSLFKKGGGGWKKYKSGVMCLMTDSRL